MIITYFENEFPYVLNCVIRRIRHAFPTHIEFIQLIKIPFASFVSVYAFFRQTQTLNQFSKRKKVKSHYHCHYLAHVLLN